MNKAFEKIFERLEERRKLHADLSISEKLSAEEREIQSRFCGCFSKSKQIVQEVAEEYNITNGDKIRSMSDEELAEFLCKVKADYQWVDHEFPSEEECGEWEEWLKSESE